MRAISGLRTAPRACVVRPVLFGPLRQGPESGCRQGTVFSIRSTGQVTRQIVLTLATSALRTAPQPCVVPPVPHVSRRRVSEFPDQWGTASAIPQVTFDILRNAERPAACELHSTPVLSAPPPVLHGLPQRALLFR